jgi:Rieske Fe-S protein
MEAGKESSRRGFLGWFVSTSVGAVCVAVLYPVLRYLSPPDVPEAQTNSVVAGKADELKPNEGRIFRFGNRPGLLVRLDDGSFKAFAATCTHLSCTVQYRGDLKEIWCACHNGMYNMEGTNVAGPPPRPLERFVVHEQGDEIVVEKAASA